MSIRLDKLKAGDLILIDDQYRWTVRNIGMFKTIVTCGHDYPEKIPKGSIITFLGDIKIPNVKSGKRFYGCYYDEQIIYISQYWLQTFKKIKGTK